jgi:HK97 family phage major capsid protein
MDLEKIKALIDEQGKAFNSFKEANDQRLAEIEKTSGQAGELQGQLEKINDELDKLDKIRDEIERVEALANRPAGGQALTELDKARAEHQKGFNSFIRSGAEAGLRDLEVKAALGDNLNTAAGGDGGYAVPEELDRQILSLMSVGYAMRELANSVTIGGSQYKKLVNLHGAASGWVGETASRPATGTPQLAELTPFMGEVYANPQATQTMLDDVFFDVEKWLAEELAEKFAEDEGSAFISGDGSNKPKGFLAYTTSTDEDGDRDFGTIQYRESSAVGSLKADDIIDLEIDLKEKLLAGAVFLCKRSTLRTIRKLKDGSGNYLWQPSLQAGIPQTLNGYPIKTDGGMPTVSAGNYALAFGNFKRGYTIVDRIGIKVLRDPYTNKPYVGFYTTKRVGGMVTDSEAIKLLKIKSS